MLDYDEASDRLMVNERTLELVQLCMDAVFGDSRAISVRLDEKDECITVEAGDINFDLVKRYEDVERRSFKGPITVKMAKFDVTSFLYDPGVWRHADGSGTPPSWDEADSGTFDKLGSAIKWMIGGIVDCVVDDTMMCADMARDIEYETVEGERDE